MLNNPLPRVEDYPDVSARNNAAIASHILPQKSVLRLIQKSARDNSRTPVQWSAGPNAGFTEGTPWFGVNPNYTEINVEAQEADPDSLLNFYRKLLKFRRDNAVALYGDYREYMPESKDFYVYERRYGSERLLVICSFSDELKRFDAPADVWLEEWSYVMGNYDYNFVIANGFTARPYELRVYRLGSEERP